MTIFVVFSLIVTAMIPVAFWKQWAQMAATLVTTIPVLIGLNMKVFYHLYSPVLLPESPPDDTHQPPSG